MDAIETTLHNWLPANNFENEFGTILRAYRERGGDEAVRLLLNYSSVLRECGVEGGSSMADECELLAHRIIKGGE